MSGFGYLDQPYVQQLLELEPSAKPGIEHLVVVHSDWCPALLGTGLCCCRPTVRKPTRNERRLIRRGKL